MAFFLNYKTTEAHRKASQKYRKKNKEKERIRSYHRTARLFIKEHANVEEVMELQYLLKERLEFLVNNMDNEEKTHYQKTLKYIEDHHIL